MSGCNGVPVIWITNFRGWNVTLKIGSKSGIPPNLEGVCVIYLYYFYLQYHKLHFCCLCSFMNGKNIV
jgi:hypothetical protein